MKLIPDSDDKGLRLDVFLARRIGNMSRARIQGLIKNGHVTVEGKTARASLRVSAGVNIELRVPDPVRIDLIPQDIPLSIIHEDSDILVVNKPAGLVVHPAAGHQDGTLVNAVLNRCRDLCGIGGELRPGIVHRLDKDTSGAMVVAKNQKAMECLADQFKAGRVEKEYLAIVRGTPCGKEGKIDTFIARSKVDRKKMSAHPAKGKHAVTFYSVVEVFASGYSLLRVRIETGRTHQIRVHMAHIGHPVAGDRQYGGRSMGLLRAGPLTGGFAPERQMLHAEKLSFTHPMTGKVCRFYAPLPGDMRDAVNILRQQS
jgi:23S rRNA pseudouridine1911/1915/1917 synthase